MTLSTSLTLSCFGDSSWRILPKDAKPEDKFVAEMVFGSFDVAMFPGSPVAHGHIYNDSRGIFRDGDRIRTSTVKQIVEIDGEVYIETRNTMYKLIDKPSFTKSVNIDTIMRDHDQRGFQPK